MLGVNIYISNKCSFEFSPKIYFSSLDFELAIEEGFACRRNLTLTFEGRASLVIGRKVFFNNNCSISCLGKIEIGNDCLFGENVKIYDHNHKYKNKNALIRNQGFDVGFVVIGNNCWIGSNVTVLKNVTIGDNCVIGANCLVYKDIPSNSVVMHVENMDIKSLI